LSFRMLNLLFANNWHYPGEILSYKGQIYHRLYSFWTWVDPPK
jgi:hypothetical protein